MDVIQVINYINFVGAEYFPPTNDKRQVIVDGEFMSLSKALEVDARNVSHVITEAGISVETKTPAPKAREAARAGAASAAARNKVTPGTASAEAVAPVKPALPALSLFRIEGVVTESQHAAWSAADNKEVTVPVADIDGALLAYLEGRMGDTIRVTVEVVKRGEKDD